MSGPPLPARNTTVPPLPAKTNGPPPLPAKSNASQNDQNLSSSAPPPLPSKTPQSNVVNNVPPSLPQRPTTQDIPKLPPKPKSDPPPSLPPKSDLPTPKSDIKSDPIPSLPPRPSLPPKPEISEPISEQPKFRRETNKQYSTMRVKPTLPSSGLEPEPSETRKTRSNSAGETVLASGIKKFDYINYGEKCAFLMIQEGTLFVAWNRRWFVVQNNSLLIYTYQADPNPAITIPFEEIVLVEEAPYMRKNFAFHVEKKGKKHYYMRGESEEEMKEWIGYIKSRCGGYKDVKVEVSVKSREERVQDTIPVIPVAIATKKTQEEIQEEAYIRAKMNQRLVQKKEKEIDVSGAICHIEIPDSETKEKPGSKKAFTQYKIKVVFTTNQIKTQEWTVYRRYKQFNELNKKILEGHLFLNYALPVKKEKKSFHPDFVEARRQQLVMFLKEIVEKHLSEILGNKSLHFQFAKFIAPVQIGTSELRGYILI